MTSANRNLVLVTVNASVHGGKEASVYGTPVGLRKLAIQLRKTIQGEATLVCFETSKAGPLLDVGIGLEVRLTDDMTIAGSAAFRNTLKFRQSKRRFYAEDSVEYTTRRAVNCCPRKDGGFAVAYPAHDDTGWKLVIAGNAIGVSHIADSFDGMADVVYGKYNPDWPEKSEHYHSWIDGDQDVMLECGLGLLTGRLDDRKDGGTGWLLDYHPNNSDELTDVILSGSKARKSG